LASVFHDFRLCWHLSHTDSSWLQPLGIVCPPLISIDCLQTHNLAC
jgi:hypothetical protein